MAQSIGYYLAPSSSSTAPSTEPLWLRQLNYERARFRGRITILLQLSIALATACLVTGHALAQDNAKTCVYISSYHEGFEWSDRVEAGLRTSLAGHCRLVQFDMDTKRKTRPEDIATATAAALELIQREDPDIVVTSDDNAARHLIVPHLLGTELPVVFSGINWTVEEYGFPAKNVTGIVEIAPLVPLIDAAIESVDNAGHAAYLSAKTLTESKNFERYTRAAKDAGIEIDQLQAVTFREWLDAFDDAQSYDFVIMGGVAGINDWDEPAAVKYVNEHTSALVVTTHDWLMPYASLGYTMIPEEQGEWAGRTAAEILNGTSPGTIPIVTNRKWDTWVNESLITASGAHVSNAILRSAKQYNP